MKTPVKKKVTLMLDADVHEGLKQKVGCRGMGEYLSQLARPHVVFGSLEASYLKLARDEENNQASRKWESTDAVIDAENIWQL